jgi:hypothetical protein
LSSLSPREAAVLLREAVAALSRRMPVEPGTLVPEASTERIAHIAATLERADGAPGGPAPSRGATGIGAEDVAALDTWIRAADGFTLHPDAREAHERAELGRRLRAVRTFIAPADRLTADPRDV